MKRALLCLLLLASATAWAASATTTTLVVSSNGSPVSSVAQGTVITLTATVSAGSTPVSPGIVLFCDNTRCTDIHRLATASLTPAGMATYKFRPGPGNHSYHALFLGTTTNLGSSSAQSTLVVTGAAKPSTVTGLTVTGTAPSYNLTATVGDSGISAPTGSVSFLDTTNNNATLANATLGAGLGPGFVTSFNSSVPIFVDALTIGDFNGDGNPDLVLSTDILNSANSPSFSVTVLPGNGDGTFGTPIVSDTRGASGPMAVGDFNGDGIPDLALPAPPTILIGKGDGSFRPVSISTSPSDSGQSIAAADFNGDGILDLAIAGTQNSIAIWLDNGDGTFTPAAVSVPLGPGNPASLVSADFNGDGIPDLAVVNNAASGGVSVFLGQGDGTFEAAPSPPSMNHPTALVAGDFNGDGRIDLATANYGSNTVTILLGNGDGTFTSTSLPVGLYPRSLAIGDFNDDGIADLAVGNGGDNAEDGNVTILLGKVDGTFTPMAQSLPAPSLLSLAVSDFNGDGRSDLAAEMDPNSVMETAMLSEPETASASAAVVLAAGPHAIVASYAGDSLYPPSTSAPVSLTGPLQASTLTLTSSPSGQVVAGQTVTLTATLSPATVSGHSTDGETIDFGGGLTAKLAGGTASVPFTVNGAETVTASYAGDDYLAPGTSNGVSFTVAPPLATTLTVSATPSTVRYEQQMLTMTAKLTPYSVQGVSAGGVSFFLVLPDGSTYPFGEAALQSGTATASVFIYPNEAPMPGPYPIMAQFAGSPAFQTASAQTPIPIAVAPADTTTSLTASPNPAMAGAPVTLSGTVNESIFSLTYEASMLFYDGTTQIAGGPMGFTSGIEIVTVSNLSPGTHTITARYTGNIFSNPSVSSPVTVTINSFTFAPAGGGSGTPSQTVSPGGKATYTLAVAPPNGQTIAAPVTFGVKGLPTGATAVFTPASLPAGSGATKVTLTVTVPTDSSSARNVPIRSAAIPIALCLFLLPVFASRKNRLRLIVLLMLLAVPAAMTFTGCGSAMNGGGSGNGSGSGNGNGGGPNPPPQAKTYNLTITATSSSVTLSVPATLIVQ